MRIGVIGTGTIAAAEVEGIAGDGHEIVVSERSRDVSAWLADAFANVRVGTNEQVIAASEVIFVALMPEVAGDVLRGLPFHDGQRVVSFMAGVSRQVLAEIVAPARAEAVVIPFPKPDITFFLDGEFSNLYRRMNDTFDSGVDENYYMDVIRYYRILAKKHHFIVLDALSDKEDIHKEISIYLEV